MNDNGPQWTLGGEEEYLLVDKDSRALVIEPPDDLMQECEERLGDQVSTELPRSQIEIGTTVCHNVQEVRDELVRLRGTIKEVANKHGLEPIASSTHPFSSWQPLSSRRSAWRLRSSSRRGCMSRFGTTTRLYESIGTASSMS